MIARIKVVLFGFLITILPIDSCAFQSEKDIILINKDSSGHEDLAILIKKVDYLKPKVLALDLTFDNTEDVYSDVSLMKAIWNSKNLVMSLGILDYTAEDKDFKLDNEMHLPKFVPFNVKSGFVEAIRDSNKFNTISRFSAYESVNNKIEKHFSLVVAELYNPQVQKEYLKKNKTRIRKIDYKNGKRKFKVLNINDVIANRVSKEVIKDKIVIIGYLGPEDIDKFYVPIDKGNGNVIISELYGPEILANIVCQILETTLKK